MTQAISRLQTRQDMVLGMVIGTPSGIILGNTRQTEKQQHKVTDASKQTSYPCQLEAPKRQVGSHAAFSAVMRRYIASIKVWRQSSDLQGGLQTDGWHQLGSPL